MGAASLAVFYVAFASVFVYLNLTTIDMPQTAAMNKALSERMKELPFSEAQSTAKFLKDIESPEDVLSWLNNVVANVIYDEQQQILARSGPGDRSDNSSEGAATVASFNRILLLRLTAKRRILEVNRFGKFKAGAATNAYPMVLKGPSTLSVDAASEDEDQSTVCMPDGSGPCFAWTESGGYADAGGYTIFIDPQEGPQAFRDRVQEWKDVGMFSTRMGTFVLDLMAFNTNTDLFVHRGWLFTFDFAGNCHQHSMVRAFNLNAFKAQGKYLEQWVLRLVLWVFVAIFVIRELMKLYNLGFYPHFRHKGAWVDAFSLLMCTIVLLTYRILESSSIYDEFSLNKLFDPSSQATVYQEMAALASQVEDQQYVIAFNLLLVFMRAVVLVAELQNNFRLILEVLDQCSSTLAYFLVMFILIMMGFVLMGFFIFGAGYRMFSTPILAFYTTTSMLTGKEVLPQISDVDEAMAPLYFYAFYLLFYLVFVNVFVSILMSGYDAVVAKMKDGEESLVTKIADEIKHEFIDRVVAFGKMAGGVVYRCPLVDACGSCFWACMPTCSMPNFGKWSCCRGSQDDDAPGHAALTGARATASSSSQPKTHLWEVMCVIAFMVNTLSFLTLQVRGEACYNLARATVIEPLQKSQWRVDSPDHVEDFEDIQSFQQVRQWTKRVFGGLLYATPQCATLLADGRAVYRSPDTQQGCNNTKNDEQLVQVINNWNVGFMNNTFVRLTITPACFVANPDKRWRDGFPWYRETPDVPCASADCISILKEENCMSPDGTSLSMSTINRIPVEESATEFYNWTNPGVDLGSHKMKGGIVVSLGTSKSDAETMLSKLEADLWFSQKSASMVFDWITYNGNLDMFTYSEVGFSLMASGRMDKMMHFITFPLNINSGGGFYSTDRVWILVLFAVYIFMVLCQCLELVRRVILIKKGKPVKRAVQDFFGDLWNVSDTISLCMAILAVIYFMMFALMPFRKDFKFSVNTFNRYQIPNDDEKEYHIPRSIDPKRYLEEDWYIFHQFTRAETLYDAFLTVSAVNCFLFAIKVVKYVGQMKSVQVFSDTLDSGKTRNSYFAIVILLQMTGFALFFHIIFGESVEELSTWGSSVLTLFKWMAGDYHMEPLLEKDQAVAVIWFVVFMVTFYFIATNMFLATMLSVYCDTVGAEDLERSQQKYRPRKDVVVHYRDKALMLDEIKPENLELREGEVVVRDLRSDTKLASAHGVQKGYILAKVNGDAKLWKERCTSIAEIFERLPEEGAVHLEFMERSSKQGDSSFKKVFSIFKRSKDDDEAEVGVKPTCKNFWRSEGAIASIAREAASGENEDGEDDGEGGRGGSGGEQGLDDPDDEGANDSGSEDEGHNGRRSSGAAKMARRRQKTKKRLDALLFSRWSEGKRQHGMDGAVGTGHGWEAFGGSDEVGGQPKEIQYEVDHIEVFQLREEMVKLPIVGQEAWLDCLVSAIEREMDDDSVIADVLRTSEMQDIQKNKPGREQKPLQEFYRHADEVVKMLEFKANKKYYQYLQIESEQRQEHLRSQNEVLHDYVCELETEFTKVMELIHTNRAKKEVMLTKLAGLLDRTMYRHLDKAVSSKGRGIRGVEEEEEDDRKRPALVLQPALRNG